jgi:hypothetical protein
MRRLQQQFFTLGPLARLAQDEEPGGIGRDTGGRRGLELEHGRTSTVSPSLVPQLQ